MTELSPSDADVTHALDAINQRFGRIDGDATLTAYSHFSDCDLGTLRELVTLVLSATSESRADADVERIADAVARRLQPKNTLYALAMPLDNKPCDARVPLLPVINIPSSTDYDPHSIAQATVRTIRRSLHHAEIPDGEGDHQLNPGTAGDD